VVGEWEVFEKREALPQKASVCRCVLKKSGFLNPIRQSLRTPCLKPLTASLKKTKTTTMKKLIASTFALFALASISFAADEKKDIVDTAVGAGSFKTLVAAVKAAGLVDTLKGDGPFTVFAPTDEAFAKLPEGTVEALLKPENKDKLVAILTYHVVSGKVMAETAVTLDKATTVQGKDIKLAVKDGKLTLNDSAKVVTADVETSNGVIHIIDAVILPPTE
jgi:uncharacterized surface protein with fasciclin (FAS1) repeats